MYEVNYNGRTSYVSDYFYCRIWPEGNVYGTERDLLARAKFFCRRFNEYMRILLIQIQNILVCIKMFCWWYVTMFFGIIIKSIRLATWHIYREVDTEDYC